MCLYVSLYNFKLESGEVGWSNTVDGTEGLLECCSVGMLMISGGVGSRIL